MCCCFRFSNKSALVVTRILMAILHFSFAGDQVEGRVSGLWNAGTNLGVCTKPFGDSVPLARSLCWHEPLPTDRKCAAGLAAIVELKNQFTGDIERNCQGNDWMAGAIGRGRRIILDYTDPPLLVLCVKRLSIVARSQLQRCPSSDRSGAAMARQNSRAIHTSSETGAVSTDEIRRPSVGSSVVDGRAFPPVALNRFGRVRTTLPEFWQRTAKFCDHPSLRPTERRLKRLPSHDTFVNTVVRVCASQG
jgi:hypothetical protein